MQNLLFLHTKWLTMILRRQTSHEHSVQPYIIWIRYGIKKSQQAAQREVVMCKRRRRVMTHDHMTAGEASWGTWRIDRNVCSLPPGDWWWTTSTDRFGDHQARPTTVTDAHQRAATRYKSTTNHLKQWRASHACRPYKGTASHPPSSRVGRRGHRMSWLINVFK